jgi:uncharacterized protein YuzE
MKYEYDQDADAAYITLHDLPRAFGQLLDDARYVDFADDNTPIGIELLAVSRGVNIEGLPEREEVERLLTEHGVKIVAPAS